GGEAELVVERDAGGEGEEADGDARVEVSGRAGAVAFEAEQVFACPEDRLDSLSDRCQVRHGQCLGLPSGPDGGGAERSDAGGEVATGVAVHRWLPSDGDKTPPTSTCPSWTLATTRAVASII